MNEIERFMQYVHNWRVKTFGKRNPQADAIKLKEEAAELFIALGKSSVRGTNDELADCFILILGIAAARGMDFKNLLDAARDKMLINECRKWNFRGDGTAQHTEQDIKDLPF